MSWGYKCSCQWIKKTTKPTNLSHTLRRAWMCLALNTVYQLLSTEKVWIWLNGCVRTPQKAPMAAAFVELHHLSWWWWLKYTHTQTHTRTLTLKQSIMAMLEPCQHPYQRVTEFRADVSYSDAAPLWPWRHVNLLHGRLVSIWTTCEAVAFRAQFFRGWPLRTFVCDLSGFWHGPYTCAGS